MHVGTAIKAPQVFAQLKDYDGLHSSQNMYYSFSGKDQNSFKNKYFLKNS
jgi:hypothetical protein